MGVQMILMIFIVSTNGEVACDTCMADCTTACDLPSEKVSKAECLIGCKTVICLPLCELIDRAG